MTLPTLNSVFIVTSPVALRVTKPFTIKIRQMRRDGRTLILSYPVPYLSEHDPLLLWDLWSRHRVNQKLCTVHKSPFEINHITSVIIAGLLNLPAHNFDNGSRNVRVSVPYWDCQCKNLDPENTHHIICKP